MGMTLSYCYLWVRIALNGGRLEIGFNTWYEWWIEPFVLWGFVVVIVIGIIGGLVYGQNESEGE